MHKAFLLLGSNEQHPLLQLQIARDKLAKEALIIHAFSSQLETIPYGKVCQSNFWNQVLMINTEMDPFELLKISLRIETAMGRVRKEKWGPRIIDLDWLFYDQLVLHTDKLILPHYDVENRWFAIHLLCEIAPNVMHPILHKTLRTIYLENHYAQAYRNNQIIKHCSR